jgi:HD-GYP domain-containing protein (c-di-GMP phosphodiesterase class II)
MAETNFSLFSLMPAEKTIAPLTYREANKEDNKNYQDIIKRVDDMFRNIMDDKLVTRSSLNTILEKLYEKWELFIIFLFGHSNRRHSPAQCAVNTAILCASMAKSMGLAESQIMPLIEGALLHDIGMLTIPKTILHKQGALSEAEQEYIYVHPVHGYKFAVDTLRCEPTTVGLMILQHHEYWDGSGYPQSLAHEGINQEARIIAVADAYTAMISDKSYREGLNAYVAMHRIVSAISCHFDPEVIKVFMQIMGKYPIGSIVKLNNGALAQIIEPNKDAVLRPRICILVDDKGTVHTKDKREIIDLKKEKDIYIDQALEFDEIPSELIALGF